MPNPLKIATLGFWHVHAGDYSRQAQEHPGTELVAVWDTDEERGKTGAEAFGAAYTSDLDALLASDIDGVVITTATDEHRDLMIKVAQAGKHIFTEKVLAPTVAEAEEIIAAADDNGVKLTVSLPRLAHGYTNAIREVLDSGRLGQVTYARVRLSHDGAIPRDGKSEGWLPLRFFEPKAAIGGALTDLGCHPVYLTQLFLGSDAETVSATYRSIAGLGLEDNAVVVVGYPNQTIGVIEAGFASPNPFTIEIFGTENTLTYTDAGNVLKVGDEQLPVPEDSLDPFGQWVDHITNGTRADDNIARALELTRLVVAANEAATTNTVVAYS
ncbi:Gfo/Idh/MocA family protein [Kribbella sp. NPDC058245]|uniref:Gfo/Idh/MocA family protein n=1 Tax=Kribbella sp. NPDC058245 TaxID=3346399 RepID=UPI0036ED4D15